MRVTGEWKVGQVSQSFAASRRGNDCGTHVAPQNLRDFQIDKMRRVKRFVGCENDAAHALGGWRLEKDFKDCGSVYDDQRLFLSARTALAGAGRGRAD